MPSFRCSDPAQPVVTNTAEEPETRETEEPEAAEPDGVEQMELDTAAGNLLNHLYAQGMLTKCVQPDLYNVYYPISIMCTTRFVYCVLHQMAMLSFRCSGPAQPVANRLLNVQTPMNQASRTHGKLSC